MSHGRPGKGALQVKTSTSDPICVDFLSPRALPGKGRLGITIAPGKKDRARGWDRDVDEDLARLRQSFRASVLVSLMEQHEYEMLGIRELLDRARACSLAVHWFPMLDVSVPRADKADEFRLLVKQVLAAVQEGETVVAHCRGGLGRSGLFVACVLAESGMSADEAIALTREARPGAIETAEQEAWVRAFSRIQNVHGGTQVVAARHSDRDRPSPAHEPSPDAPARDRVVGCLLGGALGDALGYPVEFISTAAEIRRRFGADPPANLAFAGSSPAPISDDTQMTLFVAEGIIRANQCRRDLGSSDQLAVGMRALMRWYATQTSTPVPEQEAGWLVRDRRLHARRAPGMTIMGALGNYADERSTRPHPARNDSKGCGSVMRAAPFGFLGSREEAFEAAVDNARLTHGHPTAALSAGYLAGLLWDLARGAEVTDALVRADHLLARCPHREETAAAIRAARDVATGRAGGVAALERLGGGWVAEEALAFGVASLVAFDTREPEAVERTLWRAACHGGDSDSTASIAGNLLGSMLGSNALPARWLADLELRDAIERIGLDLWTSMFGAKLLDTNDYPPN
jgi:ADP-ribosyl-[dinitrogen reductase] hydrolase